MSLILELNRNARRVAEIVGILGKYGLADWLHRMDHSWLRGKLKAADEKAFADLSTDARIRLALTELGPTFIKMGQILSTRGDLVGEDLARELDQLLDGTPADAPEVVRQTIEEELGKPPEELFAEFDDVPIAAASIGQVHRARLESGEQVAVKVQRRGIRDVIVQDLEILSGLAELAEKHTERLRPYRPVATTRELKRTLLAELDFTRELRNQERFQRNLGEDEGVVVPRPYASKSSQRTLTMQWLEGVPVVREEKLREVSGDLGAFARRIATMYLNMIFRDGFYHADPHPGNLLRMAQDRVGLLDSGMVGRIDEELRDQLEELFRCIVTKDASGLCEVIVRLGSVPAGFDRDGLRGDLGDLVDEYGSQRVKDFDLSGALDELRRIIRSHRIQLPANCTLLLKTLIMLEGTAGKLSPDFSLIELMRPFHAKMVKRRTSPRHLLRRLSRRARDWDRLIDAFPRELVDILDRVQQGRFEVNLEHRRLDSIANRLVHGTLTAALLVGSCLLWSFAAPPLIFGVSAVGVAGFLLASFQAQRLLRAIRKSGDIVNR